MKTSKMLISILTATVWISISEFVRNQFIVSTYWNDHYKKLGLIFPADNINGMVWGIWSLLFAVLTYIVARKFSLIQTAIITWIAGFLMMWVVIGNLGVLPYGILIFAVPLSLLEAYIAALIVKKIPKQ
jgi:hypothetical protein